MGRKWTFRNPIPHPKEDRISSQAPTPLVADWSSAQKGGISLASSSPSPGHYTGHIGLTPCKSEIELPNESEDWQLLFVLSLGNSAPPRSEDEMLEGTHLCLLTPSPGCPHSNSTQRSPGTLPSPSWIFGKPLGAWNKKQPAVKSPGRPINHNKESAVSFLIL